jgi:hypothetical protein
MVTTDNRLDLPGKRTWLVGAPYRSLPVKVNPAM